MRYPEYFRAATPGRVRSDDYRRELFRGKRPLSLRRTRLRFSTVGQGYLAASADPKLRHGTVTWRVDGGEGQFAQASGLITSNFTIGEEGEVVDNHFGLLFI